MATDNKVLKTVLNELVETLKDGERGYSEALTDVKDQDLKEVFKKYALQRDGYLTELESAMHNLNMHPEEAKESKVDSVVGTAHRAWINIKSVVTGNDRHAILAECERGEDYAKKAYETASKAEGIPSEIKAIIDKQAQGIKEAHDTIRGLRDSSK
ncbi:PA2169 family four-helix-bundle protein [Hymenobacter busanensis]|uniref:PA2169 family four-helix-bundle protein n=1 Tax=Hymenobacter busanensis TaxID=2607656 RepID=A0A7L4ZSA3_9BACT|nr:PA2169 family four-helix-bundle protein [Hymenobacter busanensis]KAA9327473.1 PA2169 family four-helix-bundle protein [Hymenobacter busanensis]QHJ06189.1 PA2169 family four-helix-bundle protein [Hymenobacter busanensis]